MDDKNVLNNLSLLNYSTVWLESGVLVESELNEQIEYYKSGQDNNTEHYRYKTFKKFIDDQKAITNDKLTQILSLLKTDSDKSMSGSATIDLLKKTYLTNEQFEVVVTHSKTYGNWMTKYIDKARTLHNK